MRREVSDNVISLGVDPPDIIPRKTRLERKETLAQRQYIRKVYLLDGSDSPSRFQVVVKHFEFDTISGDKDFISFGIVVSLMVHAGSYGVIILGWRVRGFGGNDVGEQRGVVDLGHDS